MKFVSMDETSARRPDARRIWENHRASWLPSFAIPSVPCRQRILPLLAEGARHYLVVLMHDFLQALLQLDRTSPKFPDQLCGVLDGGDFHDYITGLEHGTLLDLVEYLDKVWSLHQTSGPFTKSIVGPR